MGALKTSKMSKEDLKWQAESDATTMAEYQSIIDDKARMKRAIRVANDRAADLTKRANSMKAVAKMGGIRKSGRKR